MYLWPKEERGLEQKLRCLFPTPLKLWGLTPVSSVYSQWPGFIKTEVQQELAGGGDDPWCLGGWGVSSGV